MRAGQPRLGFGPRRAHPHSVDDQHSPVASCEQGEWSAAVSAGGADRSTSKRPPTRLLLTFVLVLLGSGVLISSSVYTWSIHEDKSRLAKANHNLAHRLQEAEDELKKLQELHRQLSSGAEPPLSDSLLPPPAPTPGPEPQERDTRIIQRNSPEEAELRSRAGLGPADIRGMGLSREGWTADNPEISGVLEKGATGTLWYVGRDEGWYVIDRTSHQRLLHAARLFVDSEEGKRSAAGEAAARLAQEASADAVNTGDHLSRSLHALAAAHAEGLGVPDEPLLGVSRDVLVRLVCSPLVRRVCSTRYGVGISAGAVLISNPDAELWVFDDSRAPYTSVTQVPPPTPFLCHPPPPPYPRQACSQTRSVLTPRCGLYGSHGTLVAQHLLYALFPGRMTVLGAANHRGAQHRVNAASPQRQCDLVVLEDMSAQGVEELRSLGQLSHSALVFATFPQNEAFQALNLSSPQVLFVNSLREGGRGEGWGRD